MFPLKPIACADACGNLRVATTKNYIEIFNFRQFFNHFVFTNEVAKTRNKQLKNILMFLWLLIWSVEIKNTL